MRSARAGHIRSRHLGSLAEAGVSAFSVTLFAASDAASVADTPGVPLPPNTATLIAPQPPRHRHRLRPPVISAGAAGAAAPVATASATITVASLAVSIAAADISSAAIRRHRRHHFHRRSSLASNRCPNVTLVVCKFVCARPSPVGGATASLHMPILFWVRLGSACSLYFAVCDAVCARARGSGWRVASKVSKLMRSERRESLWTMKPIIM